MSFEQRFAALTDAGLRPERAVIPSANPRNFHEAMSAAGPAELLDIDGAWVFPDGDGPHPAVLMVPGSAGVSPNHLRHAVTLVREGCAVLVVDPFTARSVTSTVANQAQYSFAASAYDVLAALRVATADPRVDPSRISAQGHSRGGAAVIASSMRVFADAVVGNLSLAGTYAAYPWCGQQFLQPRVGRTVVRAIAGERDEWLSVAGVQAQVHAINLAGGTATVRVVAGAHHSFDRLEEVHMIAEARVSPNAPIEYVADDGSMIDPVSGVPDPARTDIDQFRYAVAAGFGQKGARMGGGPGLPELFDEDMLSFHRGVLSL
ncbi:MAG: dienelactone hydrolase family protein [Acidimicrobiales bacterium]